MRRKYSHIFFDLDNTLWDFRMNSYYALKLAYDKFSVSEQEIEFGEFFAVYTIKNKKLWEMYRQKRIVKSELTTLRFQQTFDELELKGIDAPEMNAFYLAEMPKQKKLVDGAAALLEVLKRKGYSLYIITNGFAEVQHKKLELTGIQNYFMKVFISENLKAPKPDPVIFNYAIKSANAKKQASLMVGDDFDVDVLGAINAGIDAVYFNKGQEQIVSNPVQKNKNCYYSINQLLQMTNILK